MKRLFPAAVMALALSFATAVSAADEATGATHAGHGRIRSISVEEQTVRMDHEPIASLKWPKMTMNFKAHDAALLQGLKPEMDVDFELEKFGSRYEITRIAPAAH